MNYKKISVASVAVGMFAASAAFAQNAEIATWSGFRKGAASFTFDDGAPSHVTDAGPTFKKYGYKATFNLVVNCKLEPQLERIPGFGRRRSRNRKPQQ